MAWSAFAFGNVPLIAKRITQVAHGFEEGQVVVFDGTDYILSIADSELNCAGSLMVSKVVDVDTFEVAACGYITGVTFQDPYTPGGRYFLSPNNPGELTITKPTAVGEVELECFFADTTTSGWFFGGAGQLISSGNLFQWNLATGDMTVAANNGYVITAGALITLTLPAAPTIGDVIKIMTATSNGLVIDYPAGQWIRQGGITSTLTTGDFTLDTINGVLDADVTLTYQGVGLWRMSSTANWIIT